MSRRKKKSEEHENLERWLVSYADFMTLLFAFFVVMYSISAVNEGKYRVLSDSLSETFNKKPSSDVVIEFNNPLTAPVVNNSDDLIELPIPNDAEDSNEPKNPSIEEISNEIANSLEDKINEGLINLNKSDNWLEIEINSSVLFDIGGAELSEDAEDLLAEIARSIKKYPNYIQVEGYTDNIPINTPRFPSNWELSSARAASVVHLFEEEGVDPKLMQAIGYAEFRPKASNDTPEGRKANRRVKVVVLGSQNTHKVIQADKTSIDKIEEFEQQPQDFDAEAKPLIEF